MIGSYNNVCVRGIVATTPDNFVDNEKLAEQYGEKAVKKQIKVTGIKRRCVALEHQKAADMCIASAEKLLEQLCWKQDDIACLIFVSSYPSFNIPSTSFFIQEKLGIQSQCLTFDISLACSGYVAGIQTMSAMLSSSNSGKKGLLLVADVSSESVDEEDKATGLLFGDCGTATAIELVDGFAMDYMQKSDGRGYEDLIRRDMNQSFYMDGMKIFNFAISDVVDTINHFLKQVSTAREEIDLYFLHQAQKFIVDRVVDFCLISKDKVPVTYDRYGNTGCASIPLTICENQGKLRQKEKMKVFLCGFGGGHSWGCMTLELGKEVFYLVQHSNVKYEI